MNRCLLTLRQIIMHDIANAESHIGDEIGAGALGRARFHGNPWISRPPAIGASSSRYFEWMKMPLSP